LQGVEPPASAPQLAVADPIAPPVAPSPSTAEPAAATGAPQPGPPSQTTAAAPSQNAAPASAAISAPEPADVAPAAAASEAVGETAATAPAASIAPPSPAVQATLEAAASTAVATAQPAPAQEQTSENITPPTIDAIEIEGDKTFFGGAGPEGGDIRLYVDDAFIDDAKVSNGRWLVEAGPVLKNSRQRIRVDLLENGSAKVSSRAEVNFEVELPASPAAALGTAPSSTPAPPPGTPDSSTVAPAQAAAPAAHPSEPDAPAITATPGSTAPATAVTVPLAAAPAPAVKPAASAPAQTSGATTDIPTMVATSVGDPDAARFAAGNAIIRRGDNLWTIARRVYGRGIRYTTIYQANTGQIRDPDRIYPGQVFALPKNAED
jgi:nucleoid-associated protein YgaU